MKNSTKFEHNGDIHKKKEIHVKQIQGMESWNTECQTTDINRVGINLIYHIIIIIEIVFHLAYPLAKQRYFEKRAHPCTIEGLICQMKLLGLMGHDEGLESSHIL